MKNKIKKDRGKARIPTAKDLEDTEARLARSIRESNADAVEIREELDTLSKRLDRVEVVL